jgi:hypothetical protein
MEGGAGESRFELAFEPKAGLVPRVRQFVSAFYGQSLGDPDATSRVTVAAHELLDNAVKYANRSLARICIVIERGADDARTLTIETQNCTAVENLDAVRQTLDELATSTDPMSSYQRLFERSILRTTGSGLGLGRVHAEADMTLSYEIKHDEITIRAKTRLVSGAVQ